MNYGEIKQNLISLGFVEEADYKEFEDLGYTYDCINRAISQISNFFPYVAKHEIEIDEEDTGIMYLDMEDLKGFLSLTDTPVLFESDGEDMFRKFTEYEIERDNTIVLKMDDYKGSFRFYYNKQSTPVTSSTEDTFVPEIPLKAHHLIPLLTAYYLWLDDDERKATMYYNMYESELTMLMQNQNKPRANVIVDGSDI